jgi:hypothetical protein
LRNNRIPRLDTLLWPYSYNHPWLAAAVKVQIFPAL